ncbi:hypothetical protein CYY_006925 [Polysphondylium violaceum]|uniref:Uncharacterized protein n=1 Tax=Polysphondylium violaceum TaxID=133409 RepID=A0A8J4V5B8_9MYCE|nr:hypothetical protein CYY_006925 [Polysphondylium violaceum]
MANTDLFDLSDFAKMTNSDSDSDNENSKNNNDQVFDEKTVEINQKSIKIREFHYSTTNAGYIWPATFTMADYISKNIQVFNNKKIIELGSATGILSIYLKQIGLNVTASDYNDPEIQENIEYNSKLNDIHFNYIPHSWGEEFPKEKNDFDIVIASDILLYVSHFDKLISTLKQLMDERKDSFLLISYKRKMSNVRIFFDLMMKNGFQYETVGQRIWILRKSDNIDLKNPPSLHFEGDNNDEEDEN